MFESIYKSYNFQTANLNKKNMDRKFTGEKKQTNDSYGRKKRKRKENARYTLQAIKMKTRNANKRRGCPIILAVSTYFPLPRFLDSYSPPQASPITRCSPTFRSKTR